MATQSFADATGQQHWYTVPDPRIHAQGWPRDDALTRLLNLSSATLKRQVELETRLEELEVELGVWKQAHANCLDIRERDSKAHNVQITALNRQLAEMDMFNKAVRNLMFFFSLSSLISSRVSHRLSSVLSTLLIRSLILPSSCKVTMEESKRRKPSQRP
jgi:intergrase/recombinase